MRGKNILVLWTFKASVHSGLSFSVYKALTYQSHYEPLYNFKINTEHWQFYMYQLINEKLLNVFI